LFKRGGGAESARDLAAVRVNVPPFRMAGQLVGRNAGIIQRLLTDRQLALHVSQLPFEDGTMEGHAGISLNGR
jgi:hypothetical protein